MHLCKCLSLLGEMELLKAICKIWKLNNFEGKVATLAFLELYTFARIMISFFIKLQICDQDFFYRFNIIFCKFSIVVFYINLGDWLERNPTDDALVYIPSGNPESLDYRMLTLITFSSRSVEPKLLASLGYMYNSRQQAYCYSCFSEVSEEEFKINGIGAVHHTMECNHMRRINGQGKYCRNDSSAGSFLQTRSWSVMKKPTLFVLSSSNMLSRIKQALVTDTLRQYAFVCSLQIKKSILTTGVN